jgi:gliding motility-associated-like protein
MLLPEAGYTGSGTNLNLLLNTSSLSAGAVDTVVLRVEFCSTSGLSFSNTAVVSANSLPGGGFKGQDNSTNGLNPDPNGNGDPEDDGENSPTVFTQTQELFVPEGFSPNNDNVNDLFKIRGIENYPNNELSIINRWGNVVFRKKSYDNSWNGTANQGLSYGDNILPEGTYFYILDLGDKSKPLKGFIYLNHTQQ